MEPDNSGSRPCAPLCIENNIPETCPVNNKVLDKKRQLSILHRIQHLLNDQKIYLDYHLNINSFSESVGEPAKFVSAIIRHYYNTGFVQLINQYRVQHAIGLLNDKEKVKYKVDYIGSVSGFRSRSAFYQAFTSITGKSPAVYRDENNI